MDSINSETEYTNFDEWGGDLDYQAQSMGYSDHREYVQSNTFTHEPCRNEVMFLSSDEELQGYIVQGTEEEKQAALQEFKNRQMERQDKLISWIEEELLTFTVLLTILNFIYFTGKFLGY